MQHKLVSPKGTLLGSVTIPDDWSERLFTGRVPYVSGHLRPGLPVRPLTEPIATTVDITTITLMRDYSSPYRDALCLVEGSIEDFEKLNGCSFSPSMQFLRSQIEASQI